MRTRLMVQDQQTGCAVGGGAQGRERWGFLETQKRQLKNVELIKQVLKEKPTLWDAEQARRQATEALGGMGWSGMCGFLAIRSSQGSNFRFHAFSVRRGQ